MIAPRAGRLRSPATRHHSHRRNGRTNDRCARALPARSHRPGRRPSTGSTRAQAIRRLHAQCLRSNARLARARRRPLHPLRCRRRSHNRPPTGGVHRSSEHRRCIQPECPRGASARVRRVRSATCAHCRSRRSDFARSPRHDRLECARNFRPSDSRQAARASLAIQNHCHRAATERRLPRRARVRRFRSSCRGDRSPLRPWPP